MLSRVASFVQFPAFHEHRQLQPYPTLAHMHLSVLLDLMLSIVNKFANLLSSGLFMTYFIHCHSSIIGQS